MYCAIKDVCQVLNGIHFFGTNFSKGCCGQWVHQGVGKVPNGFHVSISGGRFWHRILVREELNGLGCAFGEGLWNVDPETSVVFGSSTNVPAIYTMRCPGAAIGWGFKHEDSCSWGDKGSLIKVENAVELCFCQQSRFNSQREEEVQCQSGLRE